MTNAAKTVMKRYDELAGLADECGSFGARDRDATEAATAHVLAEARMLDCGYFDRWLTDWTPDAVLWVPLVTVQPSTDQSLLLDDRRRIEERVKWRAEPTAWGQHPASRTTRVVGGVEAWTDGSRVVARSSLVIHEQRRGREQLLVGHQIHEFVGQPLQRRTKIIVLPQLEIGVRNPSFLL